MDSQEQREAGRDSGALLLCFAVFFAASHCLALSHTASHCKLRLRRGAEERAEVGMAEERSAAMTWAGIQVGLAARMRAAAPATRGAEAEVPMAST
jgi:organic hydroperoxide reductase OsmC/OhrA